MKKEDIKVNNFFGKSQKNAKQKKSLTKKISKNNTRASIKNISRDRLKSNNLGNDNLTRLTGIGPVMVKVLNSSGISTFKQLANIDVESLNDIVKDVRGSHNPASWIKQAGGMSVQINKREVSLAEKKVMKKASDKKRDNKKERSKLTNKVALLEKKVIVKKNIQSKVSGGVSKNRLTGAINFILITLFFSISLFFTNQTFQGIDFEKSIFFYMGISLAAILTSAKFLLKRKIEIRKTPFDMVMLIFVLMYGLSAGLSVDRWHSFTGFFSDPSRGFIFIGAIITSFYLLLSNFTLQTAKRALKVIVIAAVLISFYTFLSGVGLIPENIQVLVPFSLIGSLKGLAIILSAGIPLLAISYLTLRKYKHSKTAIVLQSILLVALLATIIDLIILKSFVSWTALAIGMIVMIFFLINKGGKKIGGTLGRSVVFTVLLGIILLASWAKSDYHALMPTFSRVGLPTEVHVGLPISYEIAKNSLTSGWKQGLIGSGPATFGYDFAKFSPRGMVSPVTTIEYVYQGEGMLAELISTIGLAGTVLIFVLGIIFIVQTLKALNIQNESRVYLVGLFVSSIILLTSLIINQVGGGVLIFTALILGLTVFFVLKNRDKEDYYSIDLKDVSFLKFSGVLGILVLFAGFLGGGAYAVRAYVADTYFSQALSIDDIQGRSEKIVKAIKTRPEEGVYYMKLGQTILTAINEKKKDKENVNGEEIKILGEQLMYYIKKGAELMPNDVKTQRFLATIYEQTGTKNAETMKELYQNIIKLDPNNIQYYIKMGDIYLLESKQGDRDRKLAQALEWYESAATIQPRAGFIYDRIATIFYQKDDLEKSILNVSKAVKVAPNNISYKFTLGVLYQLRGDKEDVVVAEKIFKVLLASAPQNIDVLTQLGLLYEQTGHVDEAKKQYERILVIVGEDKKLEKIKEVFKKFIENLDDGKLNIKRKVVDMTKMDDSDKSKNEVDEEALVSEKGNDTEEDVSSEIQGSREDVIITVGVEGSINVRDEGSLSGIKLTKIEETGKFQKIGENEKWVQILIPTDDGQESIKGWVHKKFITE